MDYDIRLARREELDLLPDLERDAGRRFGQLDDLAGFPPDGIPDDVTPIDELVHAHRNDHVWIAATPAGKLLGFAYGTALDGNFHLEEISVLREAGRRGIGTALVEAILRAASGAGFPAVTLSTFRHVPWNAPFYARLGFRIVPPAELTPELARAFRDEERRGLPIAIRVVMRLDLEDPERENT